MARSKDGKFVKTKGSLVIGDPRRFPAVVVELWYDGANGKWWRACVERQSKHKPRLEEVIVVDPVLRQRVPRALAIGQEIWILFGQTGASSWSLTPGRVNHQCTDHAVKEKA